MPIADGFTDHERKLLRRAGSDNLNRWLAHTASTRGCRRPVRLTGHIWGPWIPCHCKGSVPGHHIHGCGLFRICLRDGCNHHQDTTFADLPTVEEPHAFGC